MAQPPRDSDIQGFIYALELADYSRPDLIRIKVGRSDDVFCRFRDHRRQCPSQSPKLMGYYPSGVAALTTPYVKYSDGLERLVHIELTDLSAKSYPAGRNTPRLKCYDCGKRHHEIFTFKRLQGRDYGKEWQLIILPVIERWAAYVALLR